MVGHGAGPVSRFHRRDGKTKGTIMKRSFGRLINCAAAIAMLHLAVLASRAAEPGIAPSTSLTTPRIVIDRGALTPAEIVRYQSKSARAQTANHDKAAGASDKKTALIVVGVLVVVGVVALAAGGGHGGMGGGY